MKILDATAVELELHGLEGLSCYDVARRAGVPPASVYQYFPTKYALVFGLAERLFEDFEFRFLEHLEQSRARSWQAFMRELVEVGAGIHNGAPAMRLLIIGGQGSREVRVLDKALNHLLAEEIAVQFERRFGIAQNARLIRALTLATEIFDAIAANSVRECGRVDRFHTREAARAVVAYLEAFLAGSDGTGAGHDE